MNKAAPRTFSSSGTKADTLFVGSLEKGFRVLGAFDDDHPSLGITEIALRTGLDKSAAQRFSNTLHHLGFLEKDAATRRYRPARRLMEFAHTYLRHSNIAATAMPRLIEAGNVYQTTVSLAEREDQDIIYTIRIPHQKAHYVATVPGKRRPMYCTSSGLSILSQLADDEVADIIRSSEMVKFRADTLATPEDVLRAVERTRKQGFAITTGQILSREIAISAPIVNPQGHPLGAVVIQVYKPVWSMAGARKKLAPLAVETADAISGALLTSDAQA